MKCENCGNELKGNMKFCSTCGTQVPEETKSNITAKRSYAGIAAVEAVVIAILIVVVAFMATKLNDQDKSNDATSSSAVEREVASKDPIAIPEEVIIPEETTVPEETAIPEETAAPEEKKAPEEAPQADMQSEYIEGVVDMFGMELYLTQDSDSSFKMSLVNNTADDYSFGWVNGSKVTLVTTEGTYYTYLNSGVYDGKVVSGSTYNRDVRFNNASGKWLTLTFEGVRQLSSSGLPDMGFGMNGQSFTVDLESE